MIWKGIKPDGRETINHCFKSIARRNGCKIYLKHPLTGIQGHKVCKETRVKFNNKVYRPFAVCNCECHVLDAFSNEKIVKMLGTLGAKESTLMSKSRPMLFKFACMHYGEELLELAKKDKKTTTTTTIKEYDITSIIRKCKALMQNEKDKRNSIKKKKKPAKAAKKQGKKQGKKQAKKSAKKSGACSRAAD
jgi:hypothetical protein